MTKVVWTEPAIADLQAIVDFVARDSDLYASTIAERIVGRVERLAHFPESGRMVPEARSTSIRELIVGPYRVMYRARAGLVEILAIIHGARDLRRMKRKPWRR